MAEEAKYLILSLGGLTKQLLSSPPSPCNPRLHTPRLVALFLQNTFSRPLVISIGNTVSWIFFLKSKVFYILTGNMGPVPPFDSPHFTRFAYGMSGKICSLPFFLIEI